MSNHAPSFERRCVVQTEHLAEPWANWLAERVDLIKCAPDDSGWKATIARAHGLVVRTYTRVDEPLLNDMPHLKVVGRAGVGLDNIDLAACARRGITVVHTPDANTQAVIEFVMATALDAVRPRLIMEAACGLTDWQTLRDQHTATRQLNEMTVGILGLGRIGKQLARVLLPFGCRVIYHDLLDMPPDARYGAGPVTRGELLAQSDVLSIHVDARPGNRHLIDAEALNLMKPDAVLINTSRGFVVDPLALFHFLAANDHAQAWVDVHEPEPFGDDYPLLWCTNAHLTPHLAGKTKSAELAMSAVVKDVWAVLSGETPQYAAGAPDQPRAN